MGPLDGVKVIDLTTVLMGPLASRILGDMGADVVKVETPGGDSVRGVGPMRHAGMGAFYLHANRNKRSLVLDLKSPSGKEALLRLVKRADVLLYNVRPLAMSRLGLGYDDLRKVNPGLIHVGAVGYGQDGPYAKRPAFDDLMQGLSAIPSLIATSGDGVPRYIPLAVVDRFVGVTTVNAVLGALFHKQRTGDGQSIEVPMFETAAEMVLGDHLSGQTFDPPMGPAGYARSLSRYRQPFRSSDGYLCLMVYTDMQWQRFFKLIGHEEMSSDPRYATMSGRTQNIDALYGFMEEVMKQRTTQEWLGAFEALDIAATRLHDLESLPKDPHLQATGFFEWHDHPSEGRICNMKPPAKWSATPMEVRRLAPRVGEHSREVLLEAGYSDDEIREMASTGATALGISPA